MTLLVTRHLSKLGPGETDQWVLSSCPSENPRLTEETDGEADNYEVMRRMEQWGDICGAVCTASLLFGALLLTFSTQPYPAFPASLCAKGRPN